MTEQKIRLGGMALANGVLVHGPKAWAVAIRTADGELKVAAARKRFRASELEQPFLRGPATLLASATVVRLARDSRRLTPTAQELVAGIMAVAPAALALRGSDLAAYHG